MVLRCSSSRKRSITVYIGFLSLSEGSFFTSSISASYFWHFFRKRSSSPICKVRCLCSLTEKKTHTAPIISAAANKNNLPIKAPFLHCQINKLRLNIFTKSIWLNDYLSTSDTCAYSDLFEKYSRFINKCRKFFLHSDR